MRQPSSASRHPTWTTTARWPCRWPRSTLRSPGSFPRPRRATGTGHDGLLHGDQSVGLGHCGEFDEATFGRGYCEETDWCLRAAARDWRSVLVPNLFVYHVHGGTFATRERKRLLEGNLPHPAPPLARLLSGTRSLSRRDPWASYRAAAFLAMPRQRGAVPTNRATAGSGSWWSADPGNWSSSAALAVCELDLRLPLVAMLDDQR